MSTPFDVLNNPPKHWNDSLEWTEDTKPTIRHLQALLMANYERRYLTRADKLPSGAFKLMNHYLPKTFSSLSQIVNACLNLTIDASAKVGDLGISQPEYFGSAGEEFFCFLKENFFWHNLENESAMLDKLDDEGVASGRFIDRKQFAYDIFYRNNFPKNNFNKCKTISNKELMQYFIALKKLINGTHLVLVNPSLMCSTRDEFVKKRLTTFVDYDNRTDRDEDEEKPIKGFQTETSNSSLPSWNRQTRYGSCFGGSYTKGIVGEGDEDEYDYWEYVYNVYVPPLKIRNLSDIAFSVKVHWWCWAENYYWNNDGEIISNYLNPEVAFFPLTNISQIGWNDFGIFKPKDEKQIFTEQDCYVEPTNKPHWYGWGNENKNVDFDAGMDAILLDFGVEGGFNFYEKPNKYLTNGENND